MVRGAARVVMLVVSIPVTLLGQTRSRSPVLKAPLLQPTHWTLAADGNEARFIVREQLTIFETPNDAIGSTKAITGGITVAANGQVDSALSRITVDLRTLATDRPNRDRYIKSHTIVTDSFPDAGFVATDLELTAGSISAPGAFAGTLTGVMTMHGTSKTVTWDVAGTVNGQDINGKATTHIHFADFNMTQPRVMVVVSVVDDLKLEYNFHFVKSGGT